MTKEDYLENAAKMFGELTSQSKKEAFLKGYLMGLGCGEYEPNLELVGKTPEIFVSIEKDCIEIHKSVRKDHIKLAKEKLIEIYNNEGKEIPKWLQ